MSLTAAPHSAVGSHGSAPDPFQRLDRAIERRLGADLRLIYGVGMPMLVVCGIIFLLALSPSVWLVALTLVIEVALLALIVTKLLAMLGEGEDDAEEGALPSLRS